MPLRRAIRGADPCCTSAPIRSARTCSAASGMARSFYWRQTMPQDRFTVPPHEQKRAPSAQGRTLLAVRPLFLSTYPNLGAGTRNGYGSSRCPEYACACLASDADPTGDEGISAQTGKGFMKYLRTNACAICGEEQPGHETRFLVAENRWEDKLIIPPWNEQMASRAGIQVACSVNHVEELVVHWMTTGSVDYPFARTALGSGKWRRPAEPGCRVDLSGVRQIGELAVHRESMERVLAESPQSLQVILDALLEALRRETVGQADGISKREEEREEESCVVSSEPEY